VHDRSSRVRHRRSVDVLTLQDPSFVRRCGIIFDTVDVDSLGVIATRRDSYTRQLSVCEARSSRAGQRGFAYTLALWMWGVGGACDIIINCVDVNSRVVKAIMGNICNRQSSVLDKRSPRERPGACLRLIIDRKRGIAVDCVGTVHDEVDGDRRTGLIFGLSGGGTGWILRHCDGCSNREVGRGDGGRGEGGGVYTSLTDVGSRR
jgi:hypothetical protein